MKTLVAIVSGLLLLGGCCFTLDFGGTRVLSEPTRASGDVQRKPSPPITQKQPARIQPQPKPKPSRATPQTARGPITIELFVDYQCPYCRKLHATILQVRKQYHGRIRVAVRHNPLSFHPLARAAARCALAAERQGRLWPMSSRLFQSPQNLQPDRCVGLAKQLGLDMTRFEKDLRDPALDERLKRDQAYAKQKNARGTPTLFIGGKKLVGAKPFATIQQAIEQILSR